MKTAVPYLNRARAISFRSNKTFTQQQMRRKLANLALKPLRDSGYPHSSRLFKAAEEIVQNC